MPPTTEFEFDVFLSHSARDGAAVRPLAERLRKDDRFIPLWLDNVPIKVPSCDSFISTDAWRACCDGAHLTDFTPLQADKLHGSQ